MSNLFLVNIYDQIGIQTSCLKIYYETSKLLST